MTTKDEALQMALEALEYSDNCLAEIAAAHGVSSKKAKEGGPAWHVRQAIEALHEALAQKDEPEPVAIGTEWTPCVKLPIVVHVREQREGESHVSTREGITPVKHDDLIMRGVEGEEYPIGRALFDRTYTFTVYKHQEREACAMACEDTRIVKGGEVFAAKIHARGNT